MHLERGSADSVSFVSPGCAERLQGHGLAPVPVTVGDTCSPISPPTPPFCCCCRPCAMQVREEAAPAQPPLPSCAVQVAGAAFLSPSASPSMQHAFVRRVSLRLSRAAVHPLLSCPCRQSCLTPVAAPPWPRPPASMLVSEVGVAALRLCVGGAGDVLAVARGKDPARGAAQQAHVGRGLGAGGPQAGLCGFASCWALSCFGGLFRGAGWCSREGPALARGRVQPPGPVCARPA